jgi:hypothetical protein
MSTHYRELQFSRERKLNDISRISYATKKIKKPRRDFALAKTPKIGLDEMDNIKI